MAKINEIKQQAAAVKNATQVGENTAMRVGGALTGLADIAEQHDTELRKKANTSYVDTKFTEEKNRVDAELDKKFDKGSVVQESGDSKELVMSQKAVSDKLSDLTLKLFGVQVFTSSKSPILNNIRIFDNVKNGDKLTFRAEMSVDSYDQLYLGLYDTTAGAITTVFKHYTKEYRRKSVCDSLVINDSRISDTVKLCINAYTGNNRYVENCVYSVGDNTVLSTLGALKFDKSDIVQTTGEAEDKAMSQKATSVELNKKANKADMDVELNKKANKADMDVELNKKFDKGNIVQTTGESEDKVMSQKAVSDKLSDLSENTKEISHEDIQDEDDCIEFVSDSGETVGKIDNNGADFTSLKKNGVEVLTAHQDVSGLATKEEVDKKQDKIEEITTDNQADDSEEIEFKSNDGEQTYAKINNNGVYAKEFYYLNGDPINSSNIRNIFVNKDGSADFTDVVSALESINVNDANKFIHNIYISEGTYDMFADWFKDKDYNDVSLTISQLQGVLVPKNTNLIGVGKKENIILKGELPSEVKAKVSVNFSTLNLRGYDNVIENMTITCFNGRYAIHDQVGIECQDEYEHKFKNLVIIHKGFDEGATPAWDSTNNDVNHRWGSCHPLGQGTNNKANIYCEYVLFDCQNSNGASFLTHDSNSESSGGSHIVFNCCKFKNKVSTVIDISSLGANHNNTIQITDCVFKSENTPQIHGAISSLSTSKDFIYYLYGRKNNENLVVNIPEGHEENNWLI